METEQLPIYHSLSEQQQDLIKRHLLLVLEANKEINLTRINGFEESMLLHVEDSLSALPELNDSPQGVYGDLGSGAGFPGVPLAIATGRKTMLVDFRVKKMKSVEAMIQTLSLSPQIMVYPGRAELLARKKRNQFTVVSARALSKLETLMELASPLLKREGRLICYKSKVGEEEYERANKLQKRLGMKLITERSFRLGNDYERTIIVYEKHSQPQIKLPRKEGEAQKNPLEI